MITIETILKTDSGKLINGDNIEVLKTLKENLVDSCISDFPYNLSFMGRKWDTQNNFYDWCKDRATELHRVMKHGGYVLIFGHHKSNHRMKCAFEDAGFNIVEEIDWCFGSGFPKNQDIGKMFDKKAGVEREIIGAYQRPDGTERNYENWNDKHFGVGDNKTDRDRVKGNLITNPSTDLAKQWNGWKTSGLKPAKEIITVFQKPLEGKYLDNIENYGCGAMNIDACRVPTSQEDKDMINKKASKNPNDNYMSNEDKKYGDYKINNSKPANEIGRFPSNIIFDDSMGEVLDNQSGITQSGKANGNAKIGVESDNQNTPLRRGSLIPRFDEGGASRYFVNVNYEEEDFVPFFYCAKPTKKEKGEGNTHITVKPKNL